MTRVVIAEDEAIIRLDLKEILEEEGYEVVGETGRGDEAVELVRELESRPRDPRHQDAGHGRPHRRAARSRASALRRCSSSPRSASAISSSRPATRARWRTS